MGLNGIKFRLKYLHANLNIYVREGLAIDDGQWKKLIPTHLPQLHCGITNISKF